MDLTEYFTILEPQIPTIDQLRVVRKRGSVYLRLYKASKCFGRAAHLNPASLWNWASLIRLKKSYIRVRTYVVHAFYNNVSSRYFSYLTAVD